MAEFGQPSRSKTVVLKIYCEKYVLQTLHTNITNAWNVKSCLVVNVSKYGNALCVVTHILDVGIYWYKKLCWPSGLRYRLSRRGSRSFTVKENIECLYTKLRSNSTACVKFTIRTGRAWELLPMLSHSERRQWDM